MKKYFFMFTSARIKRLKNERLAEQPSTLEDIRYLFYKLP